MYQVVILSKAENDIREAAHWYNKQQLGLGLRFTRAIRSEVKTISKNPKAFVKRYKNTHTAVVDTFPFMIHYQIDDLQKTVVVTAVFHTSESPDKWRFR